MYTNFLHKVSAGSVARCFIPNINAVHKVSTVSVERCLTIVITEAASFIARSLAYRILSDEVFGANQKIIIKLYDSSDQEMLLQSIAFEISACASNLLKEVIYSDSEVVFAEADYVFFIGKARDYNFVDSSLKLCDDPFFIDSIRGSKNTAMALEKYAKKDVKIITLGNTSAKLFSEYAPSIPKENITGVMLVLQRLAASSIAKRTDSLPRDVKNLIIWGANSRSAFPYCEYATFSGGKSVMKEICDDDWFKKTLPELVEGVFRKCRYRISEALALADHCKLLLHGTPPGEWTSMSVVSDGSYGVTPGLYFSFPVYCRDGKWQIVQGLHVEDYCKNIIKKMIDTVGEKVAVALNICQRGPSLMRSSSRKSFMKSIIKSRDENFEYRLSGCTDNVCPVGNSK